MLPPARRGGRRVEKEVVGAHRHQLFEPLPHQLRRAVDARGVGALGVVIDRGEPAVGVGPRHVGALVHRHEHPLRDRVGRRIAPGLFQRLPAGSGRIARRRRCSTRPSPSSRRRPSRRGVPRPGGRPPSRSADAAVAPVLAPSCRPRAGRSAAEVDRGLGPQFPDQLDSFAKAPDAALGRHLELGIVVIAPDTDAENGTAVAHITEVRPLVRDMDRVVDRQHDDRGAEADFGRDRRRIGQHHDGIEAEDMVQGVFGHPQIAKPQRLGALGDLAQDPHAERVGDRWGRDMPSRILSFNAMLWASSLLCLAARAGDCRRKGHTFSISSICAPSGASRKRRTRRPLLGAISSSMRPRCLHLAKAPV